MYQVSTASYGNITVAPASTGGLLSPTGTTAVWNNYDATVSTPSLKVDGDISLTGDRADIKINGSSLNETLQAIRDHLLIPTEVARDHKLEQEFEELKQLGEEYQKKLKYYQEQRKIFDILKTDDK